MAARLLSADGHGLEAADGPPADGRAAGRAVCSVAYTPPACRGESMPVSSATRLNVQHCNTSSLCAPCRRGLDEQTAGRAAAEAAARGLREELGRARGEAEAAGAAAAAVKRALAAARDEARAARGAAAELEVEVRITAVLRTDKQVSELTSKVWYIAHIFHAGQEHSRCTAAVRDCLRLLLRQAAAARQAEAAARAAAHEAAAFATAAAVQRQRDAERQLAEACERQRRAEAALQAQAAAGAARERELAAAADVAHARAEQLQADVGAMQARLFRLRCL